MIARIAIVFLLIAPVASGSQPATRPTTRPEKGLTIVASYKPATRPATRPADTTNPAFLSLRDSVAKLQGKMKADNELLKVGLIDLDRPLAEQPARFIFFADTTLTLQSVLSRLHQAREHKDLRGVLINIGDTAFNLAQAQEVRDALAALNKAGKKTFAYADSYDTPSYIAASGASNVCMLEGGEIVMPGVGLEAMFAKGLLDKIGVKADYVQIGQYKGADEMFTRDHASDQVRGEMNKILDCLYAQIVDGIAYHRNLPRSGVEDAINGLVMTGKVAKDRGFVDHLVDQDGLRDLMKKELGRDIDLLADYGAGSREELDLSSPLAFMSMLAKQPKKSSKPAIAMIYVEGLIVDGEGSDGILTEGAIGSTDLRQALRIASRDANVQAIVVRIDSPGGSASASEVIWQALRRAGKAKPLVVSVGGMAASGGYYVACAGDYIFADPCAIVGSIGVVGGKFVLKELFEKIGLGSEEFTRGQNANLFSSNQPFSDSQRRLVTGWMKQIYEQFTDRVMSTRKGKIKDIDQVAQGRIFVAGQAVELGMIDEIGGIEKAVAHAAKQARLDPGQYEIRTIPPTRTLADLLRGDAGDASSPLRARVSFPQDSIVSSLSPRLGRLVRLQISVLQLLQRRPVILTCPYVLTIH